MSDFLNQFKNENYQQEMDNVQENTEPTLQEAESTPPLSQEVESPESPGQEGESNFDLATFERDFTNTSLADSISDGSKSDDEKIAEILMAINVSEAFDEEEEETIAIDFGQDDEAYEDLPEEEEAEPADDEDYENLMVEDEEDYSDNLSAAERAMRDTEIIVPVAADRIKEREPYDRGEVKRRRQSSPRSKISSPDHEVVRDTKHNKRKTTRFLLTLFVIIGALVAGFYFYWMTTQVEVPNLVGTSLTDHRNWELTNRITFEVTEQYSLEFDEGVIMSQGNLPGSHIRPGSVLRVTVSQGPDPNEHIILPNFYEMTTAEVRDWVREYRLRNVNINEEYNDIVPEGRFIRMEFVDRTVTADTYTRQDGLLIFMSRGIEILPENIPVPNFVGRTLADVEEWARQHDIDVHVIETASNTVPPDSIIAQNIEPRTLVARESDITITISLGPAVVVPNFATMTATEAAAFPGELQVIVRHRYHATVAYGQLISQSEEPGTELIGTGLEVVVTYSLGRPFLESLIGQSENVVPEIFHSFTSQGADITYTIIYMDSHLPRGQIVDMSRYNQWMEMEDHVNIWVSRGNLPPPPPPTNNDND